MEWRLVLQMEQRLALPKALYSGWPTATHSAQQLGLQMVLPTELQMVKPTALLKVQLKAPQTVLRMALTMGPLMDAWTGSLTAQRRALLREQLTAER
jgi:hypothetical protein